MPASSSCPGSGSRTWDRTPCPSSAGNGPPTGPRATTATSSTANRERPSGYARSPGTGNEPSTGKPPDDPLHHQPACSRRPNNLHESPSSAERPHTVDVSTAARVKKELGDWNLNRCVFVGDAGMVSKENLRALGRAGGRYIVCMPVHPGGKIDTEELSRRGRYREARLNLRVGEVGVATFVRFGRREAIIRRRNGLLGIATSEAIPNSGPSRKAEDYSQVSVKIWLLPEKNKSATTTITKPPPTKNA